MTYVEEYVTNFWHPLYFEFLKYHSRLGSSKKPIRRKTFLEKISKAILLQVGSFRFILNKMV